MHKYLFIYLFITVDMPTTVNLVMKCGGNKQVNNCMNEWMNECMNI